MSEGEIVSGQQSAWCLVKKLGEGDAGEVYLAESLVDARSAILKRPARSAFSGDIFRQASQIRTEAKVLKSLSAVLPPESELRVGVPALLDTSQPGAEYRDRYFIVIDQAKGIDLGSLARITQLGLSEADQNNGASLSPEYRAFLASVAGSRKIPARILITVLHRLVCLLEMIHLQPAAEDGGDEWGIVWNDVKPDHLFWDPQRSFLTIIDWGNARFLDADRTTSDRKFSWADDYRQLFEEMGRFLAVAAPELQVRLDWPGKFSLENSGPASLEALKFRLEAALLLENRHLAEARARQETLLQSPPTSEDALAEIEAVQQEILEFGELPDFEGALRFAGAYAARLAMEDSLDDLRRLSDWVTGLPGSDTAQWRMVDFLCRIPGRSQGKQRQALLDALQAAICKDWEQLMWKVVTAIQGYPEPDWWAELSATVRRLALGPEADSLRPQVAISRLTFALQASARRLEEQSAAGPTPGTGTSGLLERTRSLARRLKEDAIASWTMLEPGPPDSGLDYNAIDPLLAETAELLPAEGRAIQAILSHPRAQARLILEAWDGKDFLEASQRLRRLLLWDPDRVRVLHAEKAILAAPDFLQKVHLGPQPEDNFPDWITNLELKGRELRNQVGPAAWLDQILDSCKQIRKGVWPSDLFQIDPARLREMPWLRRFERSERIPALEPLAIATSGEKPSTPVPLAAAFPDFRGIAPGRLGPGGDLILVEPMDAWIPEARGSSARVVLGLVPYPDGHMREVAIKLMRMDQVHYALPLFREEVRVLQRMQDVPGVTPLLECGFIQLEEGAQFPLDPSLGNTAATGKLIRIGLDSAQEFQERLEERIQDGWTPYLSIEKRRQDGNLLMLCDSGMNRGHYLHMVTLLQMSIQICDILEVAHQRNIVYRDHKILHYYWQTETNGIYLIDWNVARYHSQGLSEHDLHMDLVQFGARGLHHILTGRTAPGALPLGPTRPEEIEQAANSYQAQWTYDDQRLSTGLRSLLERVLAGEYQRATDISADLKRTMMQLPDARL
jgi:serine/threonine protein kinase